MIIIRVYMIILVGKGSKIRFSLTFEPLELRSSSNMSYLHSILLEFYVIDIWLTNQSQDCDQ